MHLRNISSIAHNHTYNNPRTGSLMEMLNFGSQLNTKLEILVRRSLGLYKFLYMYLFTVHLKMPRAQTARTVSNVVFLNTFPVCRNMRICRKEINSLLEIITVA